MRRSLLAAALGVFVVSGCGEPSARQQPNDPVVQRGDTVVPEVAVAVQDQGAEGRRMAVSLLVQVHRPGRPNVAYLNDTDVSVERAVMRARITYFADDSPLGEPLEVPFVRDC